MRFLPWLAGALCLFECGRPSEPATTPPVVATTDTPSVEVESSDAAMADAATTTSADADAGPKRHPTDPTRFTCGRETCATGTETCCEASGEGVCIATLKDGPHGQIGFFKDQWEACDHAKLPYSLSGISRCDESIDCGGTDVCCEQFLFSGGSVNLCEAPNKTGATPCEYGEVCLAGSRCRIPGTECIRGYCQKPVENLRCEAGEACGSGQTCCGEPLSCKPHSECDPREPRLTCAKPSDCIKGQTCIMESERSTYCTGLVDRITPGWWEMRGIGAVCEKNADCVGKCENKAQNMRCKDSKIYEIRSCVCT